MKLTASFTVDETDRKRAEGDANQEFDSLFGIGKWKLVSCVAIGNTTDYDTGSLETNWTFIFKAKEK